ncbi:TLC domain-containing protein 5-like [Sycon ciliatum]|uniref:TLC domain-containing protein 5-like n=1 Tax=Sycon ciliatum TaxID=27933 RepID=UPI0031F621D1
MLTDYGMKVLTGTGFSFAFWSSLYATANWFNPKRSSEWNCRIVTFIHGVVLVICTSWSVFVIGPVPYRQEALGLKTSALQENLLIISFGYFLFDLLWCLVMQTEGLLMLVHHLTTVVSIASMLFIGVSGAEGTATLLGTEISNPCLQARWFLKQTASYESTLGTYVDLTFVLLFVVVRIGVGGWLFVVTMASPKVLLAVKLGGVVLYGISLLFLGQILQFAYRKFYGIKRPVPEHGKAGIAVNGNGVTKHKKS